MSTQTKVTIGRKAVPLVLRSLGPETSPTAIAELEQRLGFPLPDAYRQFLLHYNGGETVVQSVTGRDDNPAIPYQHGDGIRAFLGLASDPEYPYALRLPQEYDDWGLPSDCLPIAEDGGGNMFVMELGPRGTLVRFFDHEHYDRPLESHRVMADDFVDLLMRFRSVEEQEKLDRKVYEDEYWRIVGDPLPPKLKAQCDAVKQQYPAAERWARIAMLEIFMAKGFVAVHDDPMSRQLVDYAVWLTQHAKDRHLPASPAAPGHILMSHWGLGGYAPAFIAEWYADRKARGMLEETSKGYQLAPGAADALMKHLQSLEAKHSQIGQRRPLMNRLGGWRGILRLLFGF